jgi:hypothetical protein
MVGTGKLFTPDGRPIGGEEDFLAYAQQYISTHQPVRQQQAPQPQYVQYVQQQAPVSPQRQVQYVQQPAPQPQYVQQLVPRPAPQPQYMAPQPVRQRGRQQSERASGESVTRGKVSERASNRARRAIAGRTGKWFGR